MSLPLPRPILLLSLLLLTIISTTTTAFLLPSPSTTCRLPSTRLHLWGGGKKKETPPPAAKAPPAGQKKRATPMNYRGTVVEKNEDVIVPATEYFANKNDPIVPILFLGLALPIAGLLGWWLLGPTPEPEIAAPDQKISYDQYVKSNNVKSRKF